MLAALRGQCLRQGFCSDPAPQQGPKKWLESLLGVLQPAA
jgi:hypothetical protein